MSWTCHEHVMNMSWRYHEYIYIYISLICHEHVMNISWTYHEHITKLQPTNSKDGPFSLGFFPCAVRQDATTLRGEHAGARGDLSQLWECGGLGWAQPMACHAWKCGPHDIWVERSTIFHGTIHYFYGHFHPLVMTNVAIENGHRNSWFTH